MDNTRLTDCFDLMIANPKPMVRSEAESYKVWPTNSDRAAFVAILGAGSVEALNRTLERAHLAESGGLNLILAYRYFAKRFAEWIDARLDDADGRADGTSATFSDRLEAIWQVVSNDLQLVVIDLGSEDETQVIF